MSAPTRQQARQGALESWARTPDRTARTQPARAASPSSIEWHLNRLDPELFAAATPAQRHAAADAARRAYFARIATRSAEVRRRGGAR